MLATLRGRIVERSTVDAEQGRNPPESLAKSDVVHIAGTERSNSTASPFEVFGRRDLSDQVPGTSFEQAGSVEVGTN
jgi:hypothetical protein